MTSLRHCLPPVLCVTALALGACSSADDNAHDTADGSAAEEAAAQSHAGEPGFSAAPEGAAAAAPTSEEECHLEINLRQTKLKRVLDDKRAELKVKGKEGEEEGRAQLLSATLDVHRYDPCSEYSYVVLRGTVGSDEVRVPVFFHKDQMLSPEHVMVTSPSLNITPQGDGFEFTSDENENLAGYEGTVGKDAGGAGADFTSTIRGSEEKDTFLDVSQEEQEAPGQAPEHVKLAGDTALRMRLKGLDMVCVITKEDKKLSCFRNDGRRWQDLDAPGTELDYFALSGETGELERFINGGPVPERNFRELEPGKFYIFDSAGVQGHMLVNEDGAHIAIKGDFGTAGVSVMDEYISPTGISTDH